MQHVPSIVDVAIIGGGLAGLSAAIQLAKKNYKVVLFEKERYPFHKVCGEYISMESWNFLQELYVPLHDLNLPKINALTLTAPNGNAFTAKLPLGGFGISRHTIDHLLSNIARQQGVLLLESTKVNDVSFDGHRFVLRFSSSKELSLNEIEAKICLGSFGKRSNLDIKWRRGFITEKNTLKDNYVAVKYHVKTSWPEYLIGLHNFMDGYCGISKVDGEKYCLCYLTTAKNLKKSNNSIPLMEEKILFKNPALKKIFTGSEFLHDFPVTISQISFQRKSLVENGVLMIGDAAGMITPLCGNGMSMALHASKMVVTCADCFLKGEYNRSSIEEMYKTQWKSEFGSRMQMGRLLQGFFGAEILSNLFVATFRLFPFLANGIIKKTHGKPF